MTLHIRAPETDALAWTSRLPAMAVRDAIGRFSERAGINVRAILIETAGLAIQALARYGKVGSHPARLNGQLFRLPDGAAASCAVALQGRRQRL